MSVDISFPVIPDFKVMQKDLISNYTHFKGLSIHFHYFTNVKLYIIVFQSLPAKRQKLSLLHHNFYIIVSYITDDKLMVNQFLSIYDVCDICLQLLYSSIYEDICDFV